MTTTAPPAGPGATPPAPGPALVLRVLGIPAPQGSTRAFVIKKDGKPTSRAAVTHANGAKITAWRAAVIAEVRNAHLERALAGPVELRAVFWLPRPKDHYRSGRYAGQLRPSAPARPEGQPDLDKLLRGLGDALSAAAVWGDDCQVVAIAAAKYYARGAQPPGAHIEINRLEGGSTDG